MKKKGTWGGKFGRGKSRKNNKTYRGGQSSALRRDGDASHSKAKKQPTAQKEKKKKIILRKTPWWPWS